MGVLRRLGRADRGRSQFVYYTRRNGPKQIPPLNAAHPHLHPHAHRRNDTWPREASKGATRVERLRAGLKKKRAQSRDPASGMRPASRDEAEQLAQSWMSQTSMGGQVPRHHTMPSTSRQTSYPSSLLPGDSPPSPSVALPERGRTLTRPPQPAQPHFAPLDTISGSPASNQSPAPPGHAQFADEVLHHHEMVMSGSGGSGATAGRHGSTGRSKSRPPVTRRSTSMVFLSVGLLVSFGSWRNAGYASEAVGKVTAWGLPPPAPVSRPPQLSHPVHFHSPSPSAQLPHRNVRRQSFPISVSVALPSAPPAPPEDDEEDESPDWERVIGRASAWACTTLYLTSRIPQIWKNFRRRSVKGLSMLLFTMAFIGNTFYVLSILTNPLATTPGYLLESVPYLMGSGGTLCFDLAIVVQSFLYSEKRRDSLERDRRRRGMGRLDAEEAVALLHDDDTITSGPDSRNGSRAGSRNLSRNSSRPMSRTVSLTGRSVSRKPPTLRSSSTELKRQTAEPEEYNEEDVSRSRTRTATTSQATSLHAVGEAGESGVVLP